ncbi:MAG: class I SAM-dependent methyltransferase [Caldilineaceae bacterium]
MANATEAMVQIFDRFAHFYDADYRYYQDDLDLILDLAEQYGDPILELGCGTGRVLAPLAQAGHAVTGIDISPALLTIAQTKLDNLLATIQHATHNTQHATREANVPPPVSQSPVSGEPAGPPSPVSLHQADLRTFDLPAKDFAFAFCTSNTLMHLTTQADQLAVLRNAQRHLRPDGLLLLDLFNPDVARLQAINGIQELADQWEDPASGAQVLKWSVRTVDWAEQIQATLFIYEEILPDGVVRRTVCPFTLRFLWRGEAELLLQQAGFTLEAVWGDFEGNPYDAASEHLILLAVKK